jgi:NAD(P)-dependent dehydrogenase (short-subunit alcohol dehydrogenase family)
MWAPVTTGADPKPSAIRLAPPGVVLITGAAGGLGIAVAHALSGVADALVLMDRVEPTEVAGSLDHITPCLPVAADMRDGEALEAAMSSAVARFGAIDHLVHCAALLRMAPIGDLRPEEFLDILNVNAVGSFVVARRVAELASRGGSLVLISSVGGILSGTDSVAYGASKHALHGIVQGLALEYAAKGVRVNAICPGTMESPLWNREVAGDFHCRIGAEPREFIENARERSRLGRLPTLDQVAQLAVFLLSESASNTSGQFHVVWGSPIGFT